MSTSDKIIHRPEQSIFEIRIDAEQAVLEYQINEGAMTIYRTFVPPIFRGQGCAAKLAQAAINHARSSNLEIFSECSYIDRYLEREGSQDGSTT